MYLTYLYSHSNYFVDYIKNSFIKEKLFGVSFTCSSLSSSERVLSFREQCTIAQYTNINLVDSDYLAYFQLCRLFRDVLKSFTLPRSSMELLLWLYQTYSHAYGKVDECWRYLQVAAFCNQIRKLMNYQLEVLLCIWDISDICYMLSIICLISSFII